MNVSAGSLSLEAQALVDRVLPERRPRAVTIGNYDGFHLGHQSVLRRLLASAAERNLESLLLTLEPSPLEYFGGAENAPRIGSFDDKVRLAGQMFPALGHVVALPFNVQTAAIGAREFVRDILVGRLAMCHLAVGEDFRFGRDRAGNFALLEAESAIHGFELEAVPTLEMEGERVSSTRIRTALAEGDIPTAENLLGHPFDLRAKVVAGDRRGRTLGFPTANLDFPHTPPINGVFVITSRLDGRLCQGLANIGTRPTVDGGRRVIEAHLLDFDDNLYGRTMTVRFHRRLRSERAFSSVEQLREQIRRDIDAAREFFADA